METKESIIDPSPLGFSTYFADVHRKFQNGVLNLTNLVENFPLDVDTEITDQGLIIKQGDNIIKSSYDVCSSIRKINKEFTYKPVGFTKITYPENLRIVSYSRPPEIIPTGCWCTQCLKVGPFGHSETCNSPIQSSLRLTLSGFLKCYYPLDSAVVRKRLRNIREPEIKQAIDDFFGEINNVKEIISDEKAYVLAAKNFMKTNDILFNDSIEFTDSTDIATNIKYSAVQSFSDTNFFPGCVELQYYNKQGKKVSIRIYENKLAIVSYPWNLENPETIINKVIERINGMYGPQTFEYGGSVVKNANGKFRLFPAIVNKIIDLDKVYDYFHPVNEATGAPKLNVEGVKVSYKTSSEVEGKTVVTVNNYLESQHSDELFKYSVIKEPRRGRLSIKDIIKCNKRDGSIESSNIKVTIQIYNSGIVQLFFSYVDKDSPVPTSIKKQLGIVEESFEKIKDMLVHHFKQMDPEVFEDVEPEEESSHIWNTVPGVIPYAKRKKVELGYQIEKYDKENDEWSGIYDYVVKVKREKGKSDLVYVIPGAEAVVRSDVEKFTSLTKTVKNTQNGNLPPVRFNDGTTGYSLESYKEGKKEYLVIEGEPDDLVSINVDDYRIYKKRGDKKPYEGSSQVCAKNTKGVPVKPVPYSFYGRCQGGKTQYIDRTGVRSRSDQKYYPCCVNISSKKDEKQVHENLINFLMDGMSDEEAEASNIEIDYVHGEPIEDRYSGTLEPGVNDIGNTVTFWNGDEWIDGTIVHRKKLSGVGKDNASTQLFIESNEEVDDQEEHKKILKKITGNYENEGLKIYVITGKDLHPKYRESRKFKGLKNILKNEEDQKDLLIKCAHKLKILKPELDIEKANTNLQKQVLKELKAITGSDKFSDIVATIEPFVSKRIKRLKKYAYVAAIIPDDVLRTLLLINGSNEQYLIDSNNKVSKVDFDISDEYNGTIIDGFVTNSLDFYPVDLVYNKGVKVSKGYLEKDKGRLFDLQNIVEKINKTRTPRSLIVKKPLGSRLEDGYIGPTNEQESLMNYVFVTRGAIKTSTEILFIPQTGTSCFLLWKSRLVDQDIVLQLILKDPESGGWFLGMKRVGEKHIRLNKDPLILTKKTQDDFKNGDFVKLRINIMSNGEINPNNPYLNVRKASAEEMLPLEDTKLRLHTIIKMVDSSVFDDAEVWEFKSIKSAYMPNKSSRKPLKEI